MKILAGTTHLCMYMSLPSRYWKFFLLINFFEAMWMHSWCIAVSLVGSTLRVELSISICMPKHVRTHGGVCLVFGHR